jgi:hypothetical protein
LVNALNAKPLLVIAHDAGAANQIFALFQLVNLTEFDLVARGPAIDIFASIRVQKLSPDDLNVNSYQLVVTGTSKYSSLELSVLTLANDSGIRVISFVDHWVNFRNRFTRSGKFFKPDNLAVVDERAFSIAQTELPEANEIYIVGDSFSEVVGR